MAKNNGKTFEHALETIWKSYRITGQARIERTDPPHRIISNKVQYTSNPWLDYAGSYRGRAVIIEAKSHAATRLPWRRSGGITSKQADALLSWHDHGAVCAVLWGRAHGGTYELLIAPPSLLRRADQEKAKSLVFTDCIPAPLSGLSLLDDIVEQNRITLGTDSTTTVNSGETDTFTF